MIEFQEKIKKNLRKVKKDKLYAPFQILDLGVIINSDFQPASIYKIYRLIKKGRLKTVKIGEEKKRYFVEGSVLINFVKEFYLSK